MTLTILKLLKMGLSYILIHLIDIIVLQEVWFHILAILG